MSHAHRVARALLSFNECSGGGIFLNIFSQKKGDQLAKAAKDGVALGLPIWED